MKDIKIDITKTFDARPLYNGKSLPQYGEAELFIGDMECSKIISGMSIFLLNIVNQSTNERFISELCFISPPEQANIYSFDSIFDSVLNAFKDLYGTPPTARNIEFLKKILQVHHVKDMSIESVVEVAKKAREKSVILLPLCCKYKSSHTTKTNRGKRLLSGSYESNWVNNLVELSEGLIYEAKKNKNFIVLTDRELPPIQAENQEKIVTVDGLYPVWMGDYSKGEMGASDLQPKIMKWSALCLQGKVEKALFELENSDLNSSIIKQIKIQLLHKGDRLGQASDIIREMSDRNSIVSPEASINYSRIALQAGERELAARLIDGQINKLFTQQELELVLLVSTDLKRYDFAKEAYHRLQGLFETSAVLKENKCLRLLELVSDENPEDLNSRIFGFDEVELLTIRTTDLVEESNELIQTSQNQEKFSLIYITNAIKAAKSKDYMASLKLSIKVNSSSLYKLHSVYKIIYCLEQLILLGFDISKNEKLIKVTLNEIIEYVAVNPDLTHLRTKLFSLVSIANFGKYGLPALASLALKLASRGLRINKVRNAEKESVSNEQVTDFIRKVFDWLDKESVIELGVSSLPERLIPEDVDGHLVSLKNLLNYGVQDGREDLDITEQLAYVISLLAPHADKLIAEDLFALKLLANHFWSQNNPQLARNLAEQIIDVSLNDATRKLIAWSCYSDIYLRQAKPLDALIACCCCFSIDEAIEPKHAFEIIFLLAKITRDLHLSDISLQITANASQLVDNYDIGIQAGLRLQNLNAGIKLLEITSWKSQEASSLIDELTSLSKQVIEKGEEILPTAILLYQAVEKAKHDGLKLQKDTIEVLKEISNRLPISTLEKIRVMSSLTPEIHDIFSLNDSIQIGDFSQDRPEDLKMVKLLARRNLSHDSSNYDKKDLFNLLELLSDSATNSKAPQNESDRYELFDYATSLSSQGFTVLQIALNQNGDLRGTIIKNGIFESLVETKAFKENLLTWQKSYPHKYGDIREQEGNNVFYETMSELEISIPNTERLIVCAEPNLQQIPLNILQINRDFLGQKTSCCYVPSISWLKQLTERNKVKRNKRSAWISISQDSLGTLEIAHSRLTPVFEEYQFEVSTESKIPFHCSNSQLAVITAHGGIASDNGYFKKIADEQEFYFSPATLASSIKNCGVIVLFVCSGGKLDQSPYSETTFGLPKLLLENSCETVIASPWPLDSFFIHRWLEAFINEWDSGSCALDACFYANKTIMEENSYFAGRGLAMTLFGNPLITK
ncbi:hypothetical protein [Vibrio mangrovi]|uniref:CHAT domain protein n=1 Tax=Vibrio mangrovi TaxID=474394 RepID=A0A1Y6J1U1_9VIBR|nr:hypothetical protein [Vibrio mangrovi]MDW6005348.1 hypothetical protein [Vibrio mangrovi]SMS03060.1 CHAT domain protein [Vibrio mangrovi]